MIIDYSSDHSKERASLDPAGARSTRCRRSIQPRQVWSTHLDGLWFHVLAVTEHDRVLRPPRDDEVPTGWVKPSQVACRTPQTVQSDQSKRIVQLDGPHERACNASVIQASRPRRMIVGMCGTPRGGHHVRHRTEVMHRNRERSAILEGLVRDTESHRRGAQRQEMENDSQQETPPCPPRAKFLEFRLDRGIGGTARTIDYFTLPGLPSAEMKLVGLRPRPSCLPASACFTSSRSWPRSGGRARPDASRAPRGAGAPGPHACPRQDRVTHPP